MAKQKRTNSDLQNTTQKTRLINTKPKGKTRRSTHSEIYENQYKIVRS